MSHNFAQIRPEIGRKSADFRPEKSPGLFGSGGPGLAKKGRAGRAFKARPEARRITNLN